MLSQNTFEETLRRRTLIRPSDSTPGPEDVRAGLALDRLDALVGQLNMSGQQVERIFDISLRTIQRRRKDQAPLSPQQSDRLWRVAHIYALAERAFAQDEEAIRIWLTTSNPVLGGDSPLERLDTAPGVREVEDMLTVIDETGAA